MSYGVGIPAATAVGVGGLNTLIGATEPKAPSQPSHAQPGLNTPTPSLPEKQKAFVEKGSEGKTVADTKETKSLDLLQTMKDHPYATAAGVGIPAALIGGSMLFNRGKKKKPQPPTEGEQPEEQEKEATFLPGWK